MFVEEHCLADITFCILHISPYLFIQSTDAFSNRGKKMEFATCPRGEVCALRGSHTEQSALTKWKCSQGISRDLNCTAAFFPPKSYFALLQQDLIGSTMETFTRPCIWGDINMGSYHPQGYLTIFKWSTTLPQQSQLIHVSHSVNKTATNSWLWGLAGNSSIVCVETS